MLAVSALKRVFVSIISMSLMMSSLFTSGAERNVVIDPVLSGPYAVGSTNFSVDASKVAQLSAQGLDAGQVMGGIIHKGSAHYADELLANPSAVFSFDLDVPNDPKLYDASAGKQLPYYAVVLYPTTAENPRKDYEFYTDSVLPHMQTGNETPLFAGGAERYPVIVISHGAGVFPRTYDLDFYKVLASHGYIVLGLFHGDNRFETLEARQFNLRPLAVKMALDTLLADSNFASHIDSDRIGGLGGSFGGATMLALLGAKKVNPDVASVLFNDLIETTADSRILAAANIVPYAGQGPYSLFGLGGEGAISVDRPYMAISTSADEVTDYSKVQEVIEKISGTKYLIEVKDEKHTMGPDAVADAFAWMKVFFDAYVKKDASALDLLSRVSSASSVSEDSLVAVSEPGFTATFPEFTSNQQVKVEGVYVGAERYDVTLQLVSESPIVFTLIGATESKKSTFSTGAFANNRLTIARVMVGGAPFAVTMDVSNDNPIQFTLATAEEILEK